MWIEDVLKDIPQWAWDEIPMTFVSCTEEGCTVVGEVPEDVRPMLVRRMMLQNGLEMVALGVQFEEGVERPNVEWDSEQVDALNVLISVSLQHAGIKLEVGRHYVVGESWKIVQLPERKVIVPDTKVTALVARAQLVAGAVMSRASSR